MKATYVVEADEAVDSLDVVRTIEGLSFGAISVLKMDLSPEDIFLLGQAYILFRLGDFDEAIHLTLPGTKEDGVQVNQQFESLHVLYAELHEQCQLEEGPDPTSIHEIEAMDRKYRNLYCETLLTWATVRGLEMRK